MNITDIKAMAQLIAEHEIQKETEHGEYDVQPSINAAQRFEEICEAIEADSVEEFLAVLNVAIERVKAQMSDSARGEYNGGLGTLGSCQRQLVAAVHAGMTPAKLSRQLQPNKAISLYQSWLIALGIFIVLILVLNKTFG
jgi:hypothetical protein